MPTPRRCSLLVVSSDHSLLPILTSLLAHEFEVLTAGSVELTLGTVVSREIDIVLADQELPRTTGVQLLEWVRRHSPHTVRLLMVSHSGLKDAAAPINQGLVHHYLLKPWRIKEVIQVLRNAAAQCLPECRPELRGLNPPAIGDATGNGGVKLLVVQGRSQGKEWVFPLGEYLIGRDAGCNIRLASDWVSEHHCVLRVTHGGVFIRDLDTRNGTLVNGLRLVEQRRLAVGDEIQVGPMVLRVQPDQTATPFLGPRSDRRLLEEKLHRLNQELERRVAERDLEMREANRLLQQRSRELEMLAVTDPLTGLLNRRAIDDAARAEVKRHLRYRNPLALGLIDADHFKEINRRYLIPGGDQVLIALAGILRSALRPGDVIGRIGGDEFLVLAPHADVETAHRLAERIRSEVAQSRIDCRGEQVRLTVSLGFAVAEVGAGVDYDQMKHVAAAALSEAQARGRNRWGVRRLLPASEKPIVPDASPPPIREHVSGRGRDCSGEPVRPAGRGHLQPLRYLCLLEGLRLLLSLTFLVPLWVLLGMLLLSPPDSGLPAWWGPLVGTAIGVFLSLGYSGSRKWKFLEYIFDEDESKARD